MAGIQGNPEFCSELMPEFLFSQFFTITWSKDGTDSMETLDSMETPGSLNSMETLDFLGIPCAPHSQLEEFPWSRVLGSNQELPGLLWADPGGAGSRGIVKKSLGSPQASLSVTHWMAAKKPIN